MLCKESGGFDGPLALRAARPTSRREPHGTSKYRVVSAQEGARGARDLQPLRGWLANRPRIGSARNFGALSIGCEHRPRRSRRCFGREALARSPRPGAAMGAPPVYLRKGGNSGTPAWTFALRE